MLLLCALRCALDGLHVICGVSIHHPRQTPQRKGVVAIKHGADLSEWPRIQMVATEAFLIIQKSIRKYHFVTMKNFPAHHHDSVPLHLRKRHAILQETDGTADLDPINAKRALRKMDLHLMPILTLLYLLSFLDRGNIGNAKIEGLTESLKMTGPQFNWTCAVFIFYYSIDAYLLK